MDPLRAAPQDIAPIARAPHTPEEPVSRPNAAPLSARPALPAEISWLAPEYQHYPKSKDWFWAIGLVSVALIVVALLLRNFLFAALVALAGFAFALFSARRPRVARFTLSAQGILIHHTTYPYQHLKSFWVYYEPAGKKALSIESHKILMPFIIVPLGDVDPALIRAYLKRFLKEIEHEESIIEQIFEYIGF